MRKGKMKFSRRCGESTFRRHVGGGASMERLRVFLPTRGNREGQVSEEQTLAVITSYRVRHLSGEELEK